MTDMGHDKPTVVLLAQAKADTKGDCRHRCGPYDALGLLESLDETIPLIWWGIFNPFGPTMNTFALDRSGSAGEHLLFQIISNPFSGVEATVHGWQPADINPAVLETALLAIARDDECPLLPGAPTFVLPIYSLLGSTSLRAIVKQALASGGQRGLEGACRRMREHWCQSWDRAKAEVDAALEQRNEQTASKESGHALTDADFDVWWSLVTSEDHVVVETAAMEMAWTGAIEQVPNLPSIGVADGLHVHGSFKTSAWERLRMRAALTLTKLTDLGAKVESSQSPPAIRVNLSHTPVTDSDLRKLWKVRFTLVNLELDLSGTNITDASLPCLRGITGLRWLNLTGAQVTKRVAKSLREALPEAEIVGP